MRTFRLGLALLLPLLLTACDSGETAQTCTNTGELMVTTLKEGTGGRPTVNNVVQVSYVGRLDDGTVFDENDSSRFSLRSVIAGFRQGIAGNGDDIEAMRQGGSRRIVIPPNLGYGAEAETRGDSVSIPPCSRLTFEVTLLDIVE